MGKCQLPWWLGGDYIVDLLLPVYADGITYKDVPEEPDTEHLLGNRFYDYGICLLFALAIPLLRWGLTVAIYRPTGLYFMGKRVSKDPARMGKWVESAWKFTVYLTFSIMAFLVSYQHNWFWETRWHWLGCTRFPPCNLQVTKEVLMFYCLQTGFYIQAIHFLTFHEVRRKDWLESMIHHIATVFLLSYSYALNFTRIGVLIMLLHDISDIFLELAKMFRYCRQQTASMAAFALFFLSWVVLRMVYFPLVIIRSTLSEPIGLVGRHTEGAIDPMPHYLIFNALLLLLLVLHTYWSYLILLVLINAIKSSSINDVREGDVKPGDDSDEDFKDD